MNKEKKFFKLYGNVIPGMPNVIFCLYDEDEKTTIIKLRLGPILWPEKTAPVYIMKRFKYLIAPDLLMYIMARCNWDTLEFMQLLDTLGKSDIDLFKMQMIIEG